MLGFSGDHWCYNREFGIFMENAAVYGELFCCMENICINRKRYWFIENICVIECWCFIKIIANEIVWQGFFWRILVL